MGARDDSLTLFSSCRTHLKYLSLTQNHGFLRSGSRIGVRDDGIGTIRDDSVEPGLAKIGYNRPQEPVSPHFRKEIRGMRLEVRKSRSSRSSHLSPLASDLRVTKNLDAQRRNDESFFALYVHRENLSIALAPTTTHYPLLTAAPNALYRFKAPACKSSPRLLF